MEIEAVETEAAARAAAKEAVATGAVARAAGEEKEETGAVARAAAEEEKAGEEKGEEGSAGAVRPRGKGGGLIRRSQSRGVVSMHRPVELLAARYGARGVTGCCSWLAPPLGRINPKPVGLLAAM